MTSSCSNDRRLRFISHDQSRLCSDRRGAFCLDDSHQDECVSALSDCSIDTLYDDALMQLIDVLNPASTVDRPAWPTRLGGSLDLDPDCLMDRVCGRVEFIISRDGNIVLDGEGRRNNTSYVALTPSLRGTRNYAHARIQSGIGMDPHQPPLLNKYHFHVSLSFSTSNYFWATVCKTVRSMLWDRCLSCLSVSLSVTLVYCGQMVGWIKMPLGMEVGLGRRHTVLDGDPAPPKGAQQSPPHFSAHVYCGETVAHLNMLSSCFF